MTPEQLDAIKARAEAYPPGPWAYFGEALYGELTFADGRQVSGVGMELCQSLSFAAHARTDIPALVAEIERLQKLVLDEFDSQRVLAWMTSPNRKPASVAFTSGGERQAAYLIEIAEETLRRDIARKTA